MVNHREERLTRVFTALSDPTRRAMLARLAREPGLSVTELAAPFAIKLPAVIKHLELLAELGLVRRTKTGRTVTIEMTDGSLKAAMDWLQRHERFWSRSLDRLVAYAEAKEREAEEQGK